MGKIEKNTKGLDVYFLGDFRLVYNGDEVGLKYGKATKAMQLLAMLLYSYPEGIPTEKLIDKLFREDNILNPKGNLKVYISQLRKELTKIGLDGPSCIIYSSGKYMWGTAEEPRVDAIIFEKMIKDAVYEKSPELKTSKYRKALEMYQGDFLNEISGVDWVEELAEHYRQIAFEATDALYDIYIEKEEYSKALEAVEHISENNVSEHWQIKKIECLMKIGHYKQAAAVYEDTVTTLANEYDVKPSEELLKSYQEISQNVQNTFTPFTEIAKAFTEKKDEDGAYFCAFPGFIDSCRVIARNMTRNGQSCFLMMICLADRFGNVLTNSEVLGTSSDILRDAVQQSLRAGDSFSRYNIGQFLIFLPGTNRDNCETIADRIEQNFMEYHIRGVHLIHQEVSGAFHLEENTYE
jgi:DNA-binding SARP family transcriptional activator